VAPTTDDEVAAAICIQAIQRGNQQRRAAAVVAAVDGDGDGVVTAAEIESAELADEDKEQLTLVLAAAQAAGESLTADDAAAVLADVAAGAEEAMDDAEAMEGVLDGHTDESAVRIQAAYRGRRARRAANKTLEAVAVEGGGALTAEAVDAAAISEGEKAQLKEVIATAAEAGEEVGAEAAADVLADAAAMGTEDDVLAGHTDESAVRIQAAYSGRRARKAAEPPAAAPVALSFVILPEGFTHDTEVQLDATAAAVAQQLGEELAMQPQYMQLQHQGADVESNVTLAAAGVATGDTLQLVIAAPDAGDDGAEPDLGRMPAIDVLVDAGTADERQARTFVDRSNVEEKEYLGGYCNKRSGSEYHHGGTQTRPDANAVASSARQAVQSSDAETQTAKSASPAARQEYAAVDFSVQMDEEDLLAGVGYGERTVAPRPYVSAAQRQDSQESHALVIQSGVRGWFARRAASAMRAELQEQQEYIQTEAAARRAEADERRQQEIERRIHPRSSADFDMLHQELETWRTRETAAVRADVELNSEERHDQLKSVLSKETQLLQTIDKLRTSAQVENKDAKEQRMLEEMANPKQWAMSGGEVVDVHTPFTTRAQELQELAKGLKMRGVSSDERLDVLLHVKWTVTEFDCALTRDIVELIDREADMIHRGRPESSLKALRKRMQTLFMHFMLTPEFNPESSRFQRVPSEFLLATRTQPIRGRSAA